MHRAAIVQHPASHHQAAYDHHKQCGPCDAADGRLDLVTSDAPGAPDAAKDEGSGGPSDTEGTTIDLAKRETPEAADTAKSETPEALPDARGDVWDAETGERCTCDDVVSPSGAPAKLSWGCFCSVEDCGKTLAYFVDYADGGKVLTTGKGTVLVKEYADCSLVMVQAKTYGDYSRTSEYVFDLATGALVGARVFLDDRQHSCPFPLTDSGILWVFGYESGDYPVSTSCRESGCLAGSGTCSGVDAL